MLGSGCGTMADRSLLTSDDVGSNPAISNLYGAFITNC